MEALLPLPVYHDLSLLSRRYLKIVSQIMLCASLASGAGIIG